VRTAPATNLESRTRVSARRMFMSRYDFPLTLTASRGKKIHSCKPDGVPGNFHLRSASDPRRYLTFGHSSVATTHSTSPNEPLRSGADEQTDRQGREYFVKARTRFSPKDSSQALTCSQRPTCWIQPMAYLAAYELAAAVGGHHVANGKTDQQPANYSGQAAMQEP